uniref:Uncharacterized protein n=1 Tax=Anguilla anguilla TaxID=7936 RepID=A0A0E9QS42_ANGAN
MIYFVVDLFLDVLSTSMNTYEKFAVSFFVDGYAHDT